MPDTAARFLDAWHPGVAARDAAALGPLFTDDLTLGAPSALDGDRRIANLDVSIRPADALQAAIARVAPRTPRKLAEKR